MKNRMNVHEMEKAIESTLGKSGLSGWLADSGSFMQRLERYGVHDAQIRVLKEGWRVPRIEECQRLGLEEGQTAWIREVLIHSEHKQWMFARTVIPKATLTGEELQLRHLKNRALGSVLFKNPAMRRSEFEFFCLSPDMLWHKKIMKNVSTLQKDLWGRRSLFTLHEKTLLLTEIFFSDITSL